jgi:hypothetical protein
MNGDKYTGMEGREFFIRHEGRAVEIQKSKRLSSSERG